MSLFPVFIVGSPRSGTSILVRSLLRSGYHGFNEGNFLSLIHEVDRAVDRHFEIFGAEDGKVLMSKVSRQNLKMKLQNEIAAMAARHQNGTPWVDKTGNPEMIRSIPALRRIWPGAKFIFAKRRALENITSRLLKFPHLGFEYHCRDWAGNMAAWRILRQKAPQLPAIEIDQRDIAIRPEATAVRMGRFLEMSAACIGDIQRVFVGDRPQQTAPGSAERVLKLQDMPWTEQQKAVFEKCCGQEMRIAGYTNDETYREQE